MKHDKVMVYNFMNDYGSLVFTVPGLKSWSEEEWDSAAQSDLESYVTNPEQYYLDDCWEHDSLNTNIR
jgi:hypothetical protein